MKKIVVLTLEIDTEDEHTEEEIKKDLEQEINCASYFYNIIDCKVK